MPKIKLLMILKPLKMIHPSRSVSVLHTVEKKK
jgi:hypothetical protein